MQTDIHQDKKDVVEYEARTKEKDFIQGETKGPEYQVETKGGKNEARTEDGENKALSGGVMVKTCLAYSDFKNKYQTKTKGKNYEKQTQTDIHQDKKDNVEYEAGKEQKDFI